MAIFHLSIKPISRSLGRSATASSAYRSAQKIKDERTGEIHDYSKKQGVETSFIITPNNEKITRQELWNIAEFAEKRKDARVAREIEIAIPSELNKNIRKELVANFVKELVKQYGFATDVSIHEPSKKGDQRNHHAHILCTTRKFSAGKLYEKTDLEKENKALKAENKPNTQKQIERIREQWAILCNKTLLEHGVENKIDHRSLKAQGVDRLPTIHVGVTATAIERKGLEAERASKNKEIIEYNNNKVLLENLKAEQKQMEQDNGKPGRQSDFDITEFMREFEGQTDRSERIKSEFERRKQGISGQNKDNQRETRERNQNITQSQQKSSGRTREQGKRPEKSRERGFGMGF